MTPIIFIKLYYGRTRAEFTQFTYTDSTELECLLQDKQLRDFDLKFNGLDFYNKIPQFVNEVELFGARILKFYNNSGQIAGHLAFAKVKTIELIEYITRYCGIVNALSKFEPDLDGKTLINLSSYASDFAIYATQVVQMLHDIEHDTATDWYLSRSFINEDWVIQKHLGANLISSGNELEAGGVKLGKKYSDSVMFSIATSSVLSSALSSLTMDDISKYAAVVRTD